ncbi:hypothetical protein GALMADRAFT_1364551 [Galerina marginata CBS 339.88]|uniref:Uncharacterized protein n=1 Tax=Galerina marginata (strain CBS 339.88) TaxID=685588 RepID=A0A067SCR4_GALM3|nr:hypothetical protein GALMADRAFT_1364551 [Galerina marginata CBS 339.88]
MLALSILNLLLLRTRSRSLFLTEKDAENIDVVRRIVIAALVAEGISRTYPTPERRASAKPFKLPPSSPTQTLPRHPWAPTSVTSYGGCLERLLLKKFSFSYSMPFIGSNAECRTWAVGLEDKRTAEEAAGWLRGKTADFKDEAKETLDILRKERLERRKFTEVAITFNGAGQLEVTEAGGQKAGAWRFLIGDWGVSALRLLRAGYPQPLLRRRLHFLLLTTHLFHLRRRLTFRLWTAMVVFIDSITEMDILVFGAGLGNRLLEENVAVRAVGNTA